VIIGLEPWQAACFWGTTTVVNQEGVVTAGQITYGVFVTGIAHGVEEVRARLIADGMSAPRADELLRNIPCFAKRDVPLEKAQAYKTAFERAGLWAILENWQTTTNPAAWRPEGDTYTAVPIDQVSAPTARGSDRGAKVELELDLPELPKLDLPLAAPAEAPPPLQLSAPERARRASERKPRPTPRHALPAPGTAAGIAAAAPPRTTSRVETPIPVYGPRTDLSPLRRALPSIIKAAVVVLIGQYFYGCFQANSKVDRFHDSFKDISAFEAEVAGAMPGEVADVVAVEDAVRALGAAHGVRVDKVEIRAGRIVRTGCDEMIQAMPPWFTNQPPGDQKRLFEAAKGSCAHWLLKIDLRGQARWGMNRADAGGTFYALLHSFDPNDDSTWDVE